MALFTKKDSGKKPSGLDSIIGDMGDGEGGTKYGADMEDDEADEGSSEEEQQDRVMAAGALASALGIDTKSETFDRQKVADALEAFVKTCM